MTAITTFILMLLSLIVLLYSRYMKYQILILLFKTITSALFLCIPLSAQKGKSIRDFCLYYKLIYIGLIFSFLGDIFLALKLPGNIDFLLGVFFFACTHLCFTIAFFQYGSLSFRDIIIGCALCSSLMYLTFQTNLFHLNGLEPVVFIYGVLISFMASKSLTLLSVRKESPKFAYTTILSTYLFLVSDVILLFPLFGGEQYDYLSNVNNIIYYIGQGIMGLTFLWMKDT